MLHERRYEIRHETPAPEAYVALRDLNDMAPRSLEAAERGLPNARFSAIAIDTDTGETVGMARVVGDGGTVYHICDMAVHPGHQGRGLGSRLMDAVMDHVHDHAPETAYVNLLADVDGFYERWGFERTAPATKGMYLARESGSLDE